MWKMTIEIDVGDEPLRDRECSRCHSEEFRAIVFKRNNPDDVSGLPHIDLENGRIFNIHAAPESQSSIPLAICMGCTRIVSLI